ncbi:hypothetical protein BU26DRAFT_106207 [Trematosphaeria pertusa]|uniref:Uncharacterized protein n=1 Tax=Trematosphaeria pertusa TaxID=390896 RepID=A0A6A6I0V6_9PLEO|nr:uncharacterized protein BU26DRAFT_106207 [Trematosphaeria pertusa]KAF2243638.1 hypothetical protein BU26DRAFT_106207 [Trematosphaeria pertusa]
METSSCWLWISLGNRLKTCQGLFKVHFRSSPVSIKSCTRVSRYFLPAPGQDSARSRSSRLPCSAHRHLYWCSQA